MGACTIAPSNKSGAKKMPRPGELAVAKRELAGFPAEQKLARKSRRVNRLNGSLKCGMARGSLPLGPLQLNSARRVDLLLSAEGFPPRIINGAAAFRSAG